MMILWAVLGFLAPIFLGYALTRLFFKDLDIHEKIISSVALGTGIFGLLFFVLNEFFSIKFTFMNAFIFMISIFIISFLIIIIIRAVSKKNTKKANAKKSENFFSNDLLNLKKSMMQSFKNFFKSDLLIKSLIIIMLLVIVYKTFFFPIVNGDGIGFHAPIMRGIFNDGGMSHDVGPNTVEFTRAYPPLFFILGAWPSILNQTYDEFFIKLLPLFFGFLVLIAIYALTKNIVFKDRRKALLACFLLLTFPMFVNYSAYLSNDTIFSFFAVTAVYFTMKYLSDRKAKYLFLSFAIFGFSINVKQHGIPLFAGVLISLFFILFYKRIKQIVHSFRFMDEFKNIMKSRELKFVLIGLIFFLIIISPFFIRNYLFFGDPIYPFLSESKYFTGKNFVQFLYEPLGEMYRQTTIFNSIPHTIYGVLNYIRDTSYSMSLFFILLLVFTLVGFKKLNREQKYLLYFSMLFTLYYLYAFLIKYRYYMAITALLCVVVASKFDDLLKFRLNKKEKTFIGIFIGTLILILISYVFILIYKAYIINLFGERAAHFLSGASIMIFMHLLVTIFALSLYLILKSKRLRIVLIVCLISIPSLYGLATINYGIISDVTGSIDNTKDMDFFWKEVFQFYPDPDAVLKMNFGEDYDAQIYLRDNIPSDSKILAYGGLVYYSNKEVILIDSYKVAGTYNSTIQDSMKILKDNNIDYILYKTPGWDEFVYGIGALYAQSAITKNINNTTYFKMIYNNSQYVLYEIVRYS